MAHVVFISYASNDRTVADAICSALESKGIKCWMAPRDVMAGKEYGEEIIDAISRSRVILLVLSSSANASAQVRREVERAASKNIPITTFRIENIEPTKSLEYFVSSFHWLDATDCKPESRYHDLVNVIERLIAPSEAGPVDTAKAESTSHARAGAPIAEKKQRPLLFWLGLLLLTVSLGLLGSFFHLGMASKGGTWQPSLTILWLSLAFIVLGIPLLILSRKGIRHRWLWTGTLLFAVGVAEIPAWVFIWAYEEGFPQAPHSSAFLALSIGAFSLPLVILGAFCLWKGWPRDDAKHRRAEPVGFLIAMSLLCMVFSLVAGFEPSDLDKGTQDIVSFTEDFQSGTAKDWTLDPGWSVVLDNGNYVLEGEGASDQRAWPPVTDASAYVLEADFKLIRGRLQFNVLDSAADRYSVGVSDSGIDLIRGSSEGSATIDRTVVDVAVDLWHHVKIAVGGDRVRVWLDSQLRIDRWDQNPLGPGVISITTDQDSYACVDNIVVKPNTIPAPQDVNILSFADDFQDGVADGWRLQPGWLVVSDNGNYVLDGQGHNVVNPQGKDHRSAQPLATAATDYQFEADFVILSGTIFEFNVRYSDTGRYIIWVDSTSICLGKQLGPSSAVTFFDTAYMDIGFNQWHKVKIVVKGGNVKSYIDDNLQIDFIDQSPVSAGIFAIICNPDTHIRVDNIVVGPVD